MKLWVVGKFVEESENGKAWELMGIYDSEKKAVSACISELYFIGPALMNDSESLKNKKWEGSYYPLSKKSSN